MASQSRSIDRSSRKSSLFRASSLVLAAAVLAGCSTLHLPMGGTVQHDPAKRSAASQKTKKPRQDKSRWHSWFGPKEPPAPKSVKEWMERTERIRLEEEPEA